MMKNKLSVPITFAIIAAALIGATNAAAVSATAPVERPVATEVVSAPVETAVHALIDWIDQKKDPNRGDAVIADSLDRVIVYWKGKAPDELRIIASTQKVPVAFEEVDYSTDEMIAAAQSLIKNNRGVVTSAGPAADYSGLSIYISSKASSRSKQQLGSSNGIPVVSTGVSDSVSLSRVSQGTGADWYGGSLIRARGVHGSMCGTGMSLYAGTIEFQSTAAHCGPGIYESYDISSDVLVGPVKISRPGLDFEIIETVKSANSIWMGGAWTAGEQIVASAERPAVNEQIACSCGSSGSSTQKLYVKETGASWETDDGTLVSPGFRADNGSLAGGMGSVQRGDSGSPLIRSDSSGKLHVQGFLSKSWGLGADRCEPGSYRQGVCWTGFYAVYADAAIASIRGLHPMVG